MADEFSDRSAAAAPQTSQHRPGNRRSGGNRELRGFVGCNGVRQRVGIGQATVAAMTCESCGDDFPEHAVARCRDLALLPLAPFAVCGTVRVPVALHAITDGRDVAPSSAQGFVEALVKRLPYGASIATVTGRYWAMDRDNRWERVSRAFEAMVHARGETAPDPLTAISNSYGKGETDEFLAPTVIDGYRGAPPVDMDLLALTLARFSMLAADVADRVREIDINPLICGKEIGAVDALFVKA